MRALHMIRRHPPPTFSEPRKWSKDFNDFLSRCLVKNFEERASAEELLKVIWWLYNDIVANFFVASIYYKRF